MPNVRALENHIMILAYPHFFGIEISYMRVNTGEPENIGVRKTLTVGREVKIER